MTKPTTQKDIVRAWHLYDAKGKVLGRLAGEIAHNLMGKGKAYFVRNLDCGDYIVVINAKDIVVTGKKETEKKYYRHSGYPSGLKGEALKEVREKNPVKIVMHAVKGMLPQNKLRDTMLKRLFVFAEAEHKYEDKFTK